MWNFMRKNIVFSNYKLCTEVFWQKKLPSLLFSVSFIKSLTNTLVSTFLGHCGNILVSFVYMVALVSSRIPSCRFRSGQPAKSKALPKHSPKTLSAQILQKKHWATWTRNVFYSSEKKWLNSIQLCEAWQITTLRLSMALFRVVYTL